MRDGVQTKESLYWKLLHHHMQLTTTGTPLQIVKDTEVTSGLDWRLKQKKNIVSRHDERSISLIERWFGNFRVIWTTKFALVAFPKNIWTFWGKERRRCAAKKRYIEAMEKNLKLRKLQSVILLHGDVLRDCWIDFIGTSSKRIGLLMRYY